MCVLKCGVWSLKKAGIVCDKLCWWPLNLSTLHNYTCIKIGKFIDPKSGWDITELKFHPSKPELCPIRTIGFDKPPAGRAKLDCLKQRASRKTLSLDLLTLLNMAWTSLNSLEAPRSCALQRAPVRWTLTSEPTIGRSLRPCQSRNIKEQRIQRLQSRELSRWRHAAEVPRRSTNRPRDTRNKELNSRGKRNQKSNSLPKTTESKYTKQSVFILTKLVNSIWMQ